MLYIFITLELISFLLDRSTGFRFNNETNSAETYSNFQRKKWLFVNDLVQFNVNHFIGFL